MLICRVTGIVNVAPWQPFAELLVIVTTLGNVTAALVAFALTDTGEDSV